MTAGEGCRGAFSCFVGILHQLIEEAIRVARTHHTFHGMIEIIVDIGEDTLCDVVKAHGTIRG